MCQSVKIPWKLVVENTGYVFAIVRDTKIICGYNSLVPF